MTVMRYGEAIDYALGQAMAADPRVVTWGEDVMLIRRELLGRFGPERVRDTPISESAFLYAGIGAAMGGLKPVVEFTMIDFAAVGWAGIVNGISKFKDFSGGRWEIPLVIRAGCGGWYSDGGQHEQTFWGQLAAYPNTTVVCPSTPADAAGFMLSAVQDDGFVVFLEHQLLSEQMLDFLGGDSRDTVDFSGVVPADGAQGEVSTPIQPAPFGQAVLRRSGSDVALVSVGVGVHRCLEAAESLAADGVEASVLDLRSVFPLDREAILTQATKAGRVVVVDEDYLRGGLTGEVAALLLEAGTPAKYARVAVERTIPFAPHLEYAALPNAERITAAAKSLE
ncbi:alpha-ketoacid dehydrogenase subunit beta [Mycobacterium spongiae]|uniref:Pyruvate dehydrogenase n=1 Tax=Mycobacterium spongiae TaxID=886343 RepID=A0A975K091_9MYCO|nr:transketolase C-terminal domain-containing protein [Mycobacterium spongiae]QUR68986.1 pyruvate dehydrogenase [Mycobacterium spongiae]